MNPVDTAVVGVYTVTYNVTDANGNAAVEVTRTVNVEDPLSVAEIEKIKINIFPNPTSLLWQIKSPKLIELCEVYDLLGKKIISEKHYSKEINIDGSDLPSGVYILVINKIYKLRLVKK